MINKYQLSSLLLIGLCLPGMVGAADGFPYTLKKSNDITAQAMWISSDGQELILSNEATNESGNAQYAIYDLSAHDITLNKIARHSADPYFKLTNNDGEKTIVAMKTANTLSDFSNIRKFWNIPEDHDADLTINNITGYFSRDPYSDTQSLYQLSQDYRFFLHNEFIIGNNVANNSTNKEMSDLVADEFYLECNVNYDDDEESPVYIGDYVSGHVKAEYISPNGTTAIYQMVATYAGCDDAIPVSTESYVKVVTGLPNHPYVHTDILFQNQSLDEGNEISNVHFTSSGDAAYLQYNCTEFGPSEDAAGCGLYKLSDLQNNTTITITALRSELPRSIRVNNSVQLPIKMAWSPNGQNAYFMTCNKIRYIPKFLGGNRISTNIISLPTNAIQYLYIFNTGNHALATTSTDIYYLKHIKSKDNVKKITQFPEGVINGFQQIIINPTNDNFYVLAAGNLYAFQHD